MLKLMCHVWPYYDDEPAMVKREMWGRGEAAMVRRGMWGRGEEGSRGGSYSALNCFLHAVLS